MEEALQRETKPKLNQQAELARCDESLNKTIQIVIPLY